MYTSRALSFRGKSLILNTMCCSAIWYVGSFLIMPEIVSRKINKLLVTFLWNKKPEAVKRDTLYNLFSEVVQLPLLLEREPRTVIHVKRAKRFDPMG